MTPAPDADALPWLRFVFACIVVIGLMALLGFVLKYMRMRGFTTPARIKGRRLQVVESFALDMRRRLVIVRCDDTEHLLLLGLNQDVVIDPNLNKTALPSIQNKNAA
jgi:flagellar protein FliO/FliZ